MAEMNANRNIGLEEWQEQEMNAATLAEYLEAGHCTQHNANLAAKYLREQAAEIDRMRAALERPSDGWTLNRLLAAVDKAMGK